MQERLLNIASQFDLEGTIAEIKPLGGGVINDTFVVKTEGDAPNYILQRKNHVIFPDVPGMMENIKAVTEHIKAKVADSAFEAVSMGTGTSLNDIEKLKLYATGIKRR